MATYVKGSAVANATSYELLEKSGTTYTSLATKSEINFEVSALGLAAGDHVLVVRAKADGYTDSDYSNEITYNANGSGSSSGDDSSTITGNTATLVALCGSIWRDYEGVEVTATPAYIYHLEDRINRTAAYFIKAPAGTIISCSSTYMINVTEHSSATAESYTGTLSGWVNTYTVPSSAPYLFIHLRTAGAAGSTASPGVAGDTAAYNSVIVTINGASSLSCTSSVSNNISTYTITSA